MGDSVAREDVTAKFEDGILRLTVPKKVHREIPQTNYIAIEYHLCAGGPPHPKGCGGPPIYFSLFSSVSSA